MRKIISLLLFACILLGLSGCSDEGSVINDSTLAAAKLTAEQSAFVEFIMPQNDLGVFDYNASRNIVGVEMWATFYQKGQEPVELGQISMPVKYNKGSLATLLCKEENQFRLELIMQDYNGDRVAETYHLDIPQELKDKYTSVGYLTNQVTVEPGKDYVLFVGLYDGNPDMATMELQEYGELPDAFDVYDGAFMVQCRFTGGDRTQE